MIQGLREFKRRAKRLGITVVSVGSGSKHYTIKLRNTHGAEIIRVLSLNGQYRDRRTKNEAADLKRFARGELRGARRMTQPA